MKHFILFLLITISGLSLGQEETESIWMNLEDQDTYEFTMYKQGCFHSEVKTITVQKKGDQFMSYSSSTEGNQVLTDAELTLFQNFYQQLTTNQPLLGGCTSTNTYTIKLNGVIQTTVVDMSCSGWSPFSELITELYAKKKVDDELDLDIPNLFFTCKIM